MFKVFLGSVTCWMVSGSTSSGSWTWSCSVSLPEYCEFSAGHCLDRCICLAWLSALILSEGTRIWSPRLPLHLPCSHSCKPDQIPSPTSLCACSPPASFRSNPCCSITTSSLNVFESPFTSTCEFSPFCSNSYLVLYSDSAGIIYRTRSLLLLLATVGSWTPLFTIKFTSVSLAFIVHAERSQSSFGFSKSVQPFKRNEGWLGTFAHCVIVQWWKPIPLIRGKEMLHWGINKNLITFGFSMEIIRAVAH